MVCTGAKSEEDSRLAARKYARIVQKLGFPTKFKDFEIQNMVCSCDVKFPIRLEGLALTHRQFSSYEPELFPALTYRMVKPRIVLLIFVSGKVVLAGAKVRQEIYEAFDNIYPILKNFKKQAPTIKSLLTPSAKKGDDENSTETEAASRNLTASISSLLSSPSSQCSFTPESYRSPTKRVFCSPVKTSQVTPRRLASPLKLFSPLREIRVPQSPTANLPNFNIDGRSPRTSGVPRMKERKPSGANWLTAYAKEKKQNLDSVASQNKLQEAIGGLSSKSSQGFQKLTSKKGTKKKVVKLK